MTRFSLAEEYMSCALSWHPAVTKLAFALGAKSTAAMAAMVAAAASILQAVGDHGNRAVLSGHHTQRDASEGGAARASLLATTSGAETRRDTLRGDGGVQGAWSWGLFYH